MKKRNKIAAVVAVASCLVLPVWAATTNLTITADTLSYDGKTGRADAVGSVVITREDKTMTGASGWLIPNRRRYSYRRC